MPYIRNIRPNTSTSNNKCMDAFGHIKSVIAIILGLSIAKLLQGAVKFIQHPGRNRPYWVHLLWALYIFILLVHFWWWEYGLRALSQWLFQEYLFIIVFITLYFVLCALLFPDDSGDFNGGNAEYFYCGGSGSSECWQLASWRILWIRP